MIGVEHVIITDTTVSKTNTFIATNKYNMLFLGQLNYGTIMSIPLL